MNNVITVFLILILMCSAQRCWAENNDPPDGMEVIEVSDGHKMLVPKGAKVERDGGVLKVEGTNEFLLRKINDIEKRLQKNEENHAALKQKLDDIKAEVKTTLDKLNAALKVVESRKQFGENDLDELETLIKQLEINQKDLIRELNTIKNSFMNTP